MVSIVRSVKGSPLDENLSPEMRRLFDDLVKPRTPSKRKIRNHVPTHLVSEAVQTYGYRVDDYKVPDDGSNEAIEKLFTSEDNFTLSIIEREGSNINKVKESFKLILGREPDPEEIEAGTRFLDRGSESLKQFCWTLISGSEFRMNR